jgi:hypothetical protein
VQRHIFLARKLLCLRNRAFNPVTSKGQRGLFPCASPISVSYRIEVIETLFPAVPPGDHGYH